MCVLLLVLYRLKMPCQGLRGEQLKPLRWSVLLVALSAQHSSWGWPTERGQVNCCSSQVQRQALLKTSPK